MSKTFRFVLAWLFPLRRIRSRQSARVNRHPLRINEEHLPPSELRRVNDHLLLASQDLLDGFQVQPGFGYVRRQPEGLYSLFESFGFAFGAIGAVGRIACRFGQSS